MQWKRSHRDAQREEEIRGKKERINVLVTCKLLIVSPHYHNFQITVSNNKKAIT